MQSKITISNGSIQRPNSIDNLHLILSDYQKIARQDPMKIRLAIPSDEIWRFFINGNEQEKGRGISEIKELKNIRPSFFKFFNRNLNAYTVEQYAEKAEDKLEFKIKLVGYGWDLNKKECQEFTLSDLIHMDRGWLPYERTEPGYLMALYSAFQEIFDVTCKLDCAFIKKLHKKSLNQVKETGYKHHQNSEQPGAFRRFGYASFRVDGTNLTANGLAELLNKKNPYMFIEIDCCVGHLLINDAFLNNIRKNYRKLSFSELLSSLIAKNYIPGEFDYHMTNIAVKKLISNLFDQLSKATNNAEAAKYLYDFIILNKDNDHFIINIISLQKKNIEVTLYKEMEKLIDKYNRCINMAKKPESKLLAIISFIQSCEQLHPFADGNGRTFCTLLLNHLLLRNGFPPAMLNDPNQFDGYSKLELLDAVIMGMENCMTLIKEKKLFNIKTSDIVDFLSSKDYLKNNLQYYHKAIAIEDIFRKKLNLINETKDNSIKHSYAQKM